MATWETTIGAPVQSSYSDTYGEWTGPFGPINDVLVVGGGGAYLKRFRFTIVGNTRAQIVIPLSSTSAGAPGGAGPELTDVWENNNSAIQIHYGQVTHVTIPGPNSSEVDSGDRDPTEPYQYNIRDEHLASLKTFWAYVRTQSDLSHLKVVFDNGKSKFGAVGWSATGGAGQVSFGISSTYNFVTGATYTVTDGQGNTKLLTPSDRTGVFSGYGYNESVTLTLTVTHDDYDTLTDTRTATTQKGTYSAVDWSATGGQGIVTFRIADTYVFVADTTYRVTDGQGNTTDLTSASRSGQFSGYGDSEDVTLTLTVTHADGDYNDYTDTETVTTLPAIVLSDFGEIPFNTVEGNGRVDFAIPVSYTFVQNANYVVSAPGQTDVPLTESTRSGSYTGLTNDVSLVLTLTASHALYHDAIIRRTVTPRLVVGPDVESVLHTKYFWCVSIWNFYDRRSGHAVPGHLHFTSKKGGVTLPTRIPDNIVIKRVADTATFGMVIPSSFFASKSFNETRYAATSEDGERYKAHVDAVYRREGYTATFQSDILDFDNSSPVSFSNTSGGLGGALALILNSRAFGSQWVTPVGNKVITRRRFIDKRVEG